MTDVIDLDAENILDREPLDPAILVEFCELDASMKLDRERMEELKAILIDRVGVKNGTLSLITQGHKITTQGKLNRTLCEEDWLAIRDQIPEDCRPVNEAWVLKLDAKAAAALENSRPDLYAIVCRAITTKPAKPTVKVKPIT
jgi:hypothetical protein